MSYAKLIKQDITELINSYDFLSRQDVDFSDLTVKDPKLLSYKDTRNQHMKTRFISSFKKLANNITLVKNLAMKPGINKIAFNELAVIIPNMDYKNDTFTDHIDSLKAIASKIHIESLRKNENEDEIGVSGIVKNIPLEIRGEVAADIDEMNKCFESGCFRSVTILCGRILEAALHRVYFDATGNDLLEKSPGIGLGNIIGKLSDRDIKMDPGLTQQIHLINQIRIFSVHKKKEVFSPNKAQANAMMIYTLDVLGKIFNK